MISDKDILKYCIEAVIKVKNQREIIEHAGTEYSNEGDTLIADLKAEDILIHFFREKEFPAILLSEELMKRDKPVKLGEEFLVAIDPYDGSMNFKRRVRLPYGAIVTIFETSKPRYEDAIATAVISLTDDDLWFAQRNKGCFYQGRYSKGLEARCSVSQSQKITKETFLLADFYGIRDAEIRTRLPAGYIRNIGSAAIELSLVAEGCADARFSTVQKAHELCAGDLLIREAGGIGYTMKGEKISELKYDFNASVPCVHAGTKELAETILKAAQY